jgi:hypothetical protein
MKKIALLAACITLSASSVFAGINLSNTASSGDATPSVVQTVTLADGTLLSVAPAH